MTSVSEGLLGAISVRLEADARRLVAERQLPLPVLDVLAELGVGLRVATPRDKNHRGDLRRTSGGWEIVLDRGWENRINKAFVTGEERFTVGHEIGHYLVETQYGFRPDSRREYWELETVCSDFAGQLLVPDELVSEFVGESTSASELLSRVMALASRANVTIEPASRRLIPRLKQACALAGLYPNPHDRSGRVGWLAWVAETTQWLGSGRRRAIYMNSPLGMVIPGRHKPDKVPVFPGSSDVVVERSGTSSFLLAALLDLNVPSEVGAILRGRPNK